MAWATHELDRRYGIRDTLAGKLSLDYPSLNHQTDASTELAALLVRTNKASMCGSLPRSLPSPIPYCPGLGSGIPWPLVWQCKPMVCQVWLLGQLWFGLPWGSRSQRPFPRSPLGGSDGVLQEVFSLPLASAAAFSWMPWPPSRATLVHYPVCPPSPFTASHVPSLGPSNTPLTPLPAVPPTV